MSKQPLPGCPLDFIFVASLLQIERGQVLRSLEVRTLLSSLCSEIMCFVDKAKKKEKKRKTYEMFPRLVRTLSFRIHAWHPCSPFSQVENDRTRSKCSVTRLPQPGTRFVLVCTLRSCHAVLFFKSATLPHASLYLSITVDPSCLTVPEQGPQVLNGVIDRAWEGGWGVFLFVLVYQLKCVISGCSGFSEPPRSAVLAVTRNH